jgi:3-deoxy-D-manno-octulosonic-acid transferase
LAKHVFQGEAEMVFYMPFDIAFIINSVMRVIRPNLILIMETEIWINFLRRANRHGASVVIVNGRLSERSADRYAYVRGTINRALKYVDLALMQTNQDAARLINLGIRSRKVKVTGNIKFDQKSVKSEHNLTVYFKERFGFDDSTPLIIAASTHPLEEKWILEALKKIYLTGVPNLPRLVLVPRHPERFDEVSGLISETGLSFARRTAPLGIEDDLVDVLLLDSIGELRSIYPLGDIVFVGGSLVPRGGQSILEPALAGKTIVTGNCMTNFEAVASEFAARDAFVRLPKLEDSLVSERLATQFLEILADPALRERLGSNAISVMNENRGATARTLQLLKPLLQVNANTIGR